MRYLSANELLTEDVNIHNICVLSIREPLHHEGAFAGKKRHCDVLFLYLGGQRHYTTEDGETFTLSPGEILYVPQYATYRFRITDVTENGLDDAIAINFEMQDKDGELVSLGERPRVLVRDPYSHYHSRFQQALNMDNGMKSNPMPLKSTVYALFYEILSELAFNEAEQSPWQPILPAIDMIESLPSGDISIPTLARHCGVSETRFRQLFKQYTGGESAVQYRNRLRMEQVKRLLHTEQMTVEAAARQAGFRDMSHFYRLYKRYEHQ